MPMPTKREILEHARAKSIEYAIRHGLPAITPTEKELKETGMFIEAQRDLMTTHSDVEMQQMGYIHDVAAEVGLKVVGKGEWREQEKKLAVFKWRSRAFKHLAKPPVIFKSPIPKPPTFKIPRTVDMRKPYRRKSFKKLPTVKQLEKKISKPKPKRKKLHVTRTGKTSRRWRGKKQYVFDDSVWKVRK